MAAISRKKILSHKIIRDTFSGDKKYPGFHARMIAALIDCTIISILFLPLFSLISELFFLNNPPSEMINEAMLELVAYNENNSTAMDFMTFIKTTPKYNDYFIVENAFTKIVLNQALQFFALAAVVLTFWIKKQATIGKMLLSMKIVDATTLEKPSNKQLIIRMLSYIISVLPLFLGVIWLVFDSKKQAWHDKIANTLVIKTHKI